MSEQTHPLWNQFIRVVQEEVKPARGAPNPFLWRWLVQLPQTCQAT
jgi:L-cysteine desulfidase